MRLGTLIASTDFLNRTQQVTKQALHSTLFHKIKIAEYQEILMSVLARKIYGVVSLDCKIT